METISDTINREKTKYTHYQINREDKLLLSYINNVFSVRECANIINFTENKSYNRASLYTDFRGKEHFNEYTRKSLRCIIDDEDFADKLLFKIKKHIPLKYRGKTFHSINKRLRFLKYDNEGHFRRHADGKYVDKNNDTESLITILIYFNKGYDGAFTTFYDNTYDTIGITLKPEIGMVCFMDQDIEHEVKPMISGVKYAMRTELMYEK